MNTKTTSRVCSVCLALSLVAALTPGVLQAVSATWINGSGNYSDISKWDIPITPCNVGSTQFQVKIPENSGNINFDVANCEVDTLFLGVNNTQRILANRYFVLGQADLFGNVSILAGNSYTVLGQANIYGIVHGTGGDFTALSAIFGDGARAYAELGSNVMIGATSYSYSFTELSSSITLFSSTHPGSSLDLSSMRSLNVGLYYEPYIGPHVRTITASDAGEINMSGLRSVTSSFRGENRLIFEVTYTAMIDLSSLETVSGGGLLDLVLGDGVLQIGVLDDVTGGGRVRIFLNDPSSLLIAPASFKPDTDVTITAVADSSVTIGEDYSFAHTDETRIDLESAVVHFHGNLVTPQFIEVGGFDIGTLTPIGPNFGFGQMIVGTDVQATTVYLRDAVDNGNGHVLCGPSEEALYLLGLPTDPLDPAKIVSGLHILGGSTLVLNGIPLYTIQDGALVDVRTWFPPGQTVITYALNNSNGFIVLGSSPDTDADNDGVIDVNDNCVFVANTDQCDTNNDGYGNICDPDLNNDGIVNAEDLARHFKPFFFNGDDDADFDCNGIVQASDLAIMKKFFFQPPGPSCVAP